MSRNFDLLQLGKNGSLAEWHGNRSSVPSRSGNGSGGHLQLNAPSDDDRNWLRITGLFRKQWRLSALFALACIGAVVLFTLLMTPIYEPEARLEVSPPGAEMFRLERGDRADSDAEYLETQAREIESDGLAVAVIRDMNLAHNPTFMKAGLTTRLFGWLPSMTQPHTSHSGSSGAVVLSTEENEALLRFQENLQVKRDTASRLITVSFAGPDPALAAEITNTLVKRFVERSYQARHDAIMQSTEWLSRQLDDIRSKMEKSNEAVATFQRAHSITDVDKDRSTVTENVADLSRQKTAAETDRIQLEAYLRKVRNGNLDVLPQIQANPVIQQLSQKLAETRAELSQATAVLGDNHPTVQKLRSGIQELQAQIKLQQKAILSELQTSHLAALSREHMIGAEMQGAAKQLSEVAEYSALKRDAQANTDLYNGLYAKVKEAGIAAASISSNARVVDEARVLHKPTRPSWALNLGLGIAVGLVGAFVLPLMRDRLDDSLRDVNDVQRWTGLSSVAVVPLASPGSGIFGWGSLGVSGDGSPARFLLGRPDSPQAEALRGVETAVMLSGSARPPQVLLVASSLPGEGKTTVAINLATVLSQRGRTCIIDADLRCSMVARSFNAHQETGLGQYLSGTGALEDAMFSPRELRNLSVLPAGARTDDPGSLVCSAKMSDLLQSLRRDYQFIVLDSPPILLYADGRALSRLADGVLFVARVGEVNRDAMVRSMELLNQVNSAPILQVVVNGAEGMEQSYARYYDRVRQAS